MSATRNHGRGKPPTNGAGQVIGRVTNFHGAQIKETRSPFGGEVLYVIGTPPITTGEPVAMKGAVK